MSLRPIPKTVHAGLHPHVVLEKGSTCLRDTYRSERDPHGDLVQSHHDEENACSNLIMNILTFQLRRCLVEVVTGMCKFACQNRCVRRLVLSLHRLSTGGLPRSCQVEISAVVHMILGWIGGGINASNWLLCVAMLE